MYVALFYYYPPDLLLTLPGGYLHAEKDRCLQDFVLFYCMQVN